MLTWKIISERGTSLRFAAKVLEIRVAPIFAALSKGEESDIQAFAALPIIWDFTNKITNKNKKQKTARTNLENNFRSVEPLSSDVDLQLVARLEGESLGLRHGLVTVFLIKSAVTVSCGIISPKNKKQRISRNAITNKGERAKLNSRQISVRVYVSIHIKVQTIVRAGLSFCKYTVDHRMVAVRDERDRTSNIKIKLQIWTGTYPKPNYFEVRNSHKFIIPRVLSCRCLRIWVWGRKLTKKTQRQRHTELSNATFKVLNSNPKINFENSVTWYDMNLSPSYFLDLNIKNNCIQSNARALSSTHSRESHAW